MVTHREGSIEAALQPFAEGVGNLCNSWADLELSTAFLLMRSAGMPELTASLSIIRCFDVRAQFNAIKIAMVEFALDEEFKDLAISTINYIDNTLRTRRNRYVHDAWGPNWPDQDIHQWEWAPKIQKPQSHQPRAVRDVIARKAVLEDLWTTTSEISGHGMFLADLDEAFPKPTPEQWQTLRDRQPPQTLQPFQ